MNGVIILDKPAGFTSFDAVAVMRGLAHEKKIGHTGTLDPMATGVLPLLIGRAAKAADLLPDTDKEYMAGFRLGERFDTGDVTGRVIERSPARVSREELLRVLEGFRGDVMQVPPMYSAVSVGGQRLYKLARQGIEIEREARRIHIGALELTEFDENAQSGVLTVACSKGTYIRALIEDIAGAAGTLGVMTSLRRVRACGFTEDDAVALEDLRTLSAGGKLDTVLRPVETLFGDYPAVGVSTAQAARFCNGGGLDIGRLRMPRIALREGQRFCVFGPEGRFLGLAAVRTERNELGFLKLFAEIN